MEHHWFESRGSKTTPKWGTRSENTSLFFVSTVSCQHAAYYKSHKAANDSPLNDYEKAKEKELSAMLLSPKAIKIDGRVQNRHQGLCVWIIAVETADP